MRHAFLLLLFLLPVMAIAHDDVRPTVGNPPQLSRGDTAVYRYQHHEYSIAGGDTAVTASLVRDFSVVVVDSGPQGYQFVYTLLGVHSRDEDNRLNLSALLSNHFFSLLQGHTVVFECDTLGRPVHLPVWRQLATRMKATGKLLLDELYSTPGLEQRLPRDSVEASFSQLFGSERGMIGNFFGEMSQLFRYSGQTFPLGWTQQSYTKAQEGQLESRLTTFADTVARGRHDYDPYGGILANQELITIIPISTIVDRVGRTAWDDSLRSDRQVMPLVEQAIDSTDAGTVRLTDNRMLTYFFSGWPKELLVTHQAEYISERRLKSTRARLAQDYIVWIRMKEH